jgi:hypothetical protein
MLPARCRLYLIVSWLVLFVPPGAVRADVIDRVLAVVDGQLVTMSDVRVALVLGLVPITEAASKGSDQAGQAPSDHTPLDKTALDQALDRWIDRILALQEVERFAPPEPAATAIDIRLADILSALGPPDERASRLSALGVDEAWLRQWVRDDLRIQSYVEQRFMGAMEPTAEELENYFREYRGEFVQAGQELTPAEAQAAARAGVMAARRRALVTDWLVGLRRRAEILKPAPR